MAWGTKLMCARDLPPWGHPQPVSLSVGVIHSFMAGITALGDHRAPRAA